MPFGKDSSPDFFPNFSARERSGRASLFWMAIAFCFVAVLPICTPAASEPFTSSYWLQKGDGFLAYDSYDLAVKCYDEVIELDPDNFLAWNNKGMSLYKMGLFEASNDAFAKALDINLASSTAWNNKGKALFDLGRYDESYYAQRKALEIDPNNAEAWLDEGKALDEMNRKYGSNEAYSKALEIDPNNADAWYRKGNALYELELFNESNEAIDRALSIDPFNADAWYINSMVLDRLGRYNESQKALRRSEEIELLNADAWITKGDALYGLNLKDDSRYAYNEANKIYSKLLERNDNANILFRKGKVLYNLGEYGDGRDSFDRSYEIYNRDPANNYRADILYIKGQIREILGIIYSSNLYYEKSLEGYKEMLNSDPRNAYAWHRTGEILQKLDNDIESKAAFSRELEIYNAYLKKNDKNASIWLSRGEVLSLLGEKDASDAAYAKAIKIYNRFLEADPYNITILYKIGDTLFKMKKYHESNEVFDDAFKIRNQALFIPTKDKNSIITYSNSSASYWIQKGNALFDERKYLLAIKCYDKAIEIDPKSAVAWNNKGKAHWYYYRYSSNTLDRSTALSSFDQAIKLDPLFAEAWKNRGELLVYNDYDEALNSYIRANEIDPSIQVPNYLYFESRSVKSVSNKSIYKVEKEDIAPFITIVITYIIIFIIYNRLTKIKKAPEIEKLTIWSQRHIILRNFYMPLRIWMLVKLLFLLCLLSGPIIYISQNYSSLTKALPDMLIGLSLLTILTLAIIAIGMIITVILWLLFCPPLIPCGNRAIWADLEQQMKHKVLFNRIDKIAMAYFFASGFIIAAYLLFEAESGRNIPSSYVNFTFGTLCSWVLVASLITILPSLIGVLLSKNMDRQTAKSVFISQFGLVSVIGFWVFVILYFLAENHSSLKDWTSDFGLLTAFILIPIYIMFLLIPYLEGLRRAEKQREKLYNIRQNWLDRLSDILEVPTPSQYIPKLENLLKELEAERLSFIENDEMVKQWVIWDKDKNAKAEPKVLDKCQIMREAYLKSKDLDPRFLHLDFLENLRIHVGECIQQLKLASQMGNSELIAAASHYSTVYHSKKDEITEIINADRKTKPSWTVALATIITTVITLILTPILTRFGNIGAEIVSKKPP
jgi:tetratricopeptide (TPR) repeat protein